MANIHFGFTRGCLLDPSILNSYNGIRFIGDVHGEFEKLEVVLRKCADDKMFPVSLGDLVDRGPQSKLCLMIFMNLMNTGHGFFVPGNHEVKHVGKLNGDKPKRWSDDQEKVHQEILRMSVKDRTSFIRHVENGPRWGMIGDVYFAHATWSPLVEKALRVPLSASEEVTLLRQITYGHLSVEAIKAEHYNVMSGFGWIDRIPYGKHVIVGHTVLDEYDPMPVVIEGRSGGRAYFIDTDCGTDENGYITTMDYMRDGKLRLPKGMLDYTRKYRAFAKEAVRV